MDVGDVIEVELPSGVCVNVQLTSLESRGEPMLITGWGFGDAEPPEPAEFTWEARDLCLDEVVDLDEDEIQHIESVVYWRVSR